MSRGLGDVYKRQAHNLFNGGCKEHCGQKVKVIGNKNKLENINDQINIESKNSCLNKSLCRGWPFEIFLIVLWSLFFDNDH